MEYDYPQTAKSLLAWKESNVSLAARRLEVTISPVMRLNLWRSPTLSHRNHLIQSAVPGREEETLCNLGLYNGPVTVRNPKELLSTLLPSNKVVS